MIEITEKEFKNRKDYYCDKAESGTVVLVEKPDGAKVATLPTKVFDKMYNHVLTDAGLAIFEEDFKNLKA